jgi:hypothetical protein
MEQLGATWNQKLEKEARDCETRERVERERAILLSAAQVQSTPAPTNPRGDGRVTMLTIERVSTVALTHTWKQLADIFGDIQAKAPGQMFSATFMPVEGDSNAFSRDWVLGGSPDCRTDFEILASIAARKLGYMPREGATDYWLDLIREWMQDRGLDKDKNVAFRANTSPGQALDILEIAAMSARFCTNLMVRGTPESAVASPLTDSDSRLGLAPSTAERPTRLTGKVKTPTANERNRRRIIFSVLLKNVKGLKYCKALDDQKLAIPQEWSQDNCPNTYSGAYRAGQPWRKRIQDEKSRYRKKRDQTPVGQR